ncbi:MAG: hypothetical protein CM1200mP26_22620 [Acidimicrobiales bacterium]|nr:MAG: hypothetical protein CM1200mP26_22620 [Acidimicrobiales bacterium]
MNPDGWRWVAGPERGAQAEFSYDVFSGSPAGGAGHN